MTQTLLSAERSIGLSTEEIALLMKTLHSKSPEVVQARMAHALLLLSDGLSVEDVAGLLYISLDVVAGWQAIFARHAGAKAA